MQKIIYGIANLPEILRAIDCKKVFLVVDSSFPFLNIKDDIEHMGYPHVAYSGINVPLVAVSNVPLVAVSNVPAVAE